MFLKVKKIALMRTKILMRRRKKKMVMILMRRRKKKMVMMMKRKMRKMMRRRRKKKKMMMIDGLMFLLKIMISMKLMKTNCLIIKALMILINQKK